MTRVDDTGSNLVLGNEPDATVTFDGGQALWQAHKRSKTPAEILAEFNQERHLFGV